MTELPQAPRQLREVTPRIESMGATLVAVVCQSRAAVEAFFAQHPLPFPLIVDEDRSRARAWGVHHPLGFDAFNIARHSTFVIDGQGLIRYAFVAPNQFRRAEIDRVLTALAEAFQLTLALDTPLAKALTIGGRFGLLLLTSPNEFGVPVDLRLRVRLQRFYLDFLVGPWFLFDEPDPVRADVAFGFGLVASGLTFGLEVGWLDPSTLVGLRLAFRL